MAGDGLTRLLGDQNERRPRADVPDRGRLIRNCVPACLYLGRQSKSCSNRVLVPEIDELIALATSKTLRTLRDAGLESE